MLPRLADNPNVPSFNQTAFSVDVNPDTPEGELLLTVTAHYNDAGSCGLGKCACVDILYAIESGNERMLFAIDARTGDLFTSKLLYPYTGQEHEYVPYNNNNFSNNNNINSNNSNYSNNSNTIKNSNNSNTTNNTSNTSNNSST